MSLVKMYRDDAPLPNHVAEYAATASTDDKKRQKAEYGGEHMLAKDAGARQLTAPWCPCSRLAGGLSRLLSLHPPVCVCHSPGQVCRLGRGPSKAARRGL